MGGIVGRLFSEFAVTLSIAVLISLVVSLTTTPMMCALILPREHVGAARAPLSGDASMSSTRCWLSIAGRLAWRSPPGAVALTLLATIGLNYYMFRYEIT